MRALRILVSLLLAVGVSAQPFETEVTSPTREALDAALASCPRSAGARNPARGCRIRLPAGPIRGNWRIGGSTAQTVQEGVCLIGQGPGLGSTVPDGKVGAAGTVLVYDGPPGGILLDLGGGNFPCLRDITLAMDGAAVGLRLNATNAGSAPIQLPFFERVAIRGNMYRPAGIGMLITGAARNDQVDALLAQSITIDDVDVGIEVDSNQAVTNRIGPGSKITAQRAAVRVRAGSLSLDGVLAQCRTANCCTYDLIAGHGYFRVRDGYHEIGDKPAANAKLLCLARDPRPEVASWNMVSIAESYINVQCDASQGPCSVDLITGRSNVSVVFRDNWIIATQPVVAHIGRTFANVLFSGPYGRPRLVWSGNGVSTAMGGVRATIGARVGVEAFADDGKRTWNDRNLNGRWDESEPTISGP